MYESILNHENSHYLLLQPKDSYVEKIEDTFISKKVSKKLKRRKIKTSQVI